MFSNEGLLIVFEMFSLMETEHFTSHKRTLLKTKAPLVYLKVSCQKVNKCSCQEPGLVTFHVPGFRIIRFIIIVLILANIITWFKNTCTTCQQTILFGNKYYSEVIKSVKLAE